MFTKIEAISKNSSWNGVKTDFYCKKNELHHYNLVKSKCKSKTSKMEKRGKNSIEAHVVYDQFGQEGVGIIKKFLHFWNP